MSKNIRKAIALLLCLVLVVSVAACGKTESSPELEVSTESVEPVTDSRLNFTPGKYLGEAQGYGGTLKLEIEVDEISITNINVLEHSETNGIGTTAIEQLPDTIIQSQSLAVDTITGCTKTSNAIIDASKTALETSGVDMAALMAAIDAGAPTGEAKEMKTQLVIVGAGGAGMTAAIRARELGIDVIVIEKMPFVGGATAMSSSSALTVNTRVQAEQGIVDSKELAMEDLMKVGENKNDPIPLGMLAEFSGATVDWLNDDMGIMFKEEMGSASAEYSVPRARSAVSGSGASLSVELKNKMEELGAELYLDTEAYELIDSDGVVTGVKAKKTDGSQYTINADAVLLATGGYCFDEQYISDSLAGIPCSGSIANTGDGLKMALAYDAKLQNMEYIAVAGHGIRKGSSAQHTKPGCIVTYSTTGTILVNQDGQRFVNERDRDAVVVEKMLEQDRYFMVMDQAAFDIYTTNSLEKSYYSQADLDEWMANDGKGTTVVAHGDTLADVAAKVDMDGTKLAASVDRYNGFIDSGSDDDFGRNVGGEKISDAGPYYLFEQSLRYSTTLGGVSIDENLHIINEAGTAIPGLYAAGEFVGGVFGTHFPPSTGVGWALTSGMLAADKIAAAL